MADASEAPAPPADPSSGEQARHEIHSLVIDTGPIIHNPSSISSLQSKAGVLLTIPSVANEVRDENTRNAFETQWKPFLTFRVPKPESVKYVADFAKRTGDYAGLSVTDLQLLGLTYEVWKEKGSVKAAPDKSGDKKRRKKGSGKKKAAAAASKASTKPVVDDDGWTSVPKGRAAKLKAIAKISPQQALANEAASEAAKAESSKTQDVAETQDVQMEDESMQAKEPQTRLEDTPDAQLQREFDLHGIEESLSSLNISAQTEQQESAVEEQAHEVVIESDSESDDEADTSSPDPAKDDTEAPPTAEGATLTADLSTEPAQDDDPDAGEWITPTNLPEHLSSSTITTPTTPKSQIPVACTTSDFAMQNVLLQLRIYLYSPSSLHRISSTRTIVLRCHGCFKLIRDDLSKQFCTSCGGATLTKVTAGTDSDGKFKVFLKKDWQWNNRGNVYAIPKPRGGTASMKGVREELILREDQKEYERAKRETRRRKETDLMDADYLPGLLTGERAGKGGSVKVGAGKNVNAVKRGGKK